MSLKYPSSYALFNHPGPKDGEYGAEPIKTYPEQLPQSQHYNLVGIKSFSFNKLLLMLTKLLSAATSPNTTLPQSLCQSAKCSVSGCTSFCRQQGVLAQNFIPW